MTTPALHDLDARYGEAMRRLTSAMLGDTERAAAVTRDTQLAAFAALHTGAVTVDRNLLGSWLLEFAGRYAAREQLQSARAA